MAAAVRPREPWEAMDLGFVTVRAWRRAVWGAWLLFFAPTVLLAALVFRRSPIWLYVFVWWLKPLFDAAVLFVLSRALFDERPDAKAALAAARRTLLRVVLPALTIGRLDPARSFTLPVRQLEGLRGRERFARLRVLAREGWGHGAMLTGTCALFELAVALGLAMLAVAFVPGLNGPFGPSAPLDAAWGPIPTSVRWLLSGSILAAMTLVEPFYVGAGFALYLNRRTELEAWDVEIAFRRLAARLRKAAAVVLVLLACGSALAAPDPEEVAKEVLSSPDFGKTETVKVWRVRSSGSDERSADLTALSQILGEIATPLLWTLAAVAVAFLVWKIVSAAGLPALLWRAGPPVHAPPEALFGLDIRPESLPDDLVGAARAAWEAGDAAGALSLLYRGALARLAAEGGLELAKSATEGDCVRRVEAAAPGPRATFFRALTEAWQVAAYGHRAPAVDRATALLAGWPEHFGAAS